MLVSYKWLNEYLPVTEDPIKLADQISRTGIETEEVFLREQGMKKVVVGHVLKSEPHPNSDHLHICQVDVGESEPYQIVCGAPNVAAGQYVIVALPNSWIADHTKIKKSKMRGEVSMGMICALQEIGFPEAVVPKAYANGIYVFNEPHTPGESVFPLLGMDDPILNLDITPNRADTLGMHGAAWEIGAMLNEKPQFTKPTVTETGAPIDDLLTAKVADDASLSYHLRIVQNVHIHESPLWLQVRLWNAGVRPINNIVDITNYVMLEYGQPLHAFDYDKLKNKEILVRHAQPGETLTTLDGNDHELVAQDIVITDGQDPIALAGVMGGLSTEVTEKTKTVVFEAAVFPPTPIRKTAQRYNLRSQASTRFEKGINKADVLTALDHAAQLAEQLAEANTAKGVLSPANMDVLPVVVDISIDRINHVLGTTLSTDTVRDIFGRLGFGVEEADGLFTVSIPPRRWDISIEADLIEEVARLYGYDNLPSTLPEATTTVARFTPIQKLIRYSKRSLLAAGLNEAISYALVNEDEATEFMQEKSVPTHLDWPMTKDHAVLRQSLLPGLIDDLAYNIAHSVKDVALFEQGRVFLKDDEKTVRPREVEYLAGLISGQWQGRAWETTEQPADFYLVKGIVENYLAPLHLADPIRYTATDQYSEMHPGRTANIYLGDQLLGFIGEVHPARTAAINAADTFVFQLNLDIILAAKKVALMAQDAPKYPSVTRDIALLLPEEVTNAQVLATIRAHGGEFLQNVQLFDVYKGEKLPAGTQSLAYTLTFLNPADTLKESQVNADFSRISEQLEKQLHAQIR
ncbi:phenylalanine--tRNA ligase subunit beta [Schleiferilactobacillus perolens]|uniref:Phenylalanine--tRNA ligase beta subunit n=1 Tax=Schleiferilactobacillus perolens DSM 12744 TaxID=1423792 RepID=A0A0R1N7F6_9LACO|nr:phenylalanine--tRNA ligase subunit beta [Schleiferilactobacillus perolens]KRL12899.1 phenylalanyl-tRNA synthetase subunit beta [Schleiferilactobacillus perolens DSM 12744]